MIKNILFVLFLFCTSFVFSQNKDGKTAEQANPIEIKNDSTPRLIAFDKSTWSKNNNSVKNDTLPKPELKAFAINQITSNSKENDSIITPKPELIPYTGYKKGNEN